MERSMEDIVPASCDGCLGRREFLARSALFAAAAAALAACGAVDSTSPGGGLNGAVTVKVSDYSSLSSVGGIALVNAGGEPIAVVRTGTSTYAALSRVCPHQGGIVNVNGSGFLCPVHGARFDSSGGWIGGQPTSNLHAYSTSFDASTQILTIS